jgi:polyisoprenoid-binding protein YceI
MRLAVLGLLACAVIPGVTRAQAPVFKITPELSKIDFSVKASVALEGKFEKWEASLTFPSTDVATGVMDIKIYADSVTTGSGMKDGKLKGKDFFNVKEDPYITFHSDKIVQTGPGTFDLPGTFTVRGVSKPETLTFTLADVAAARAAGEGEIKGKMAFDRKDYGMNKGIPFVTIADRVEVTVNLKAKRISGPPLVLKQ